MAEKAKRFKDLRIWQVAVELVKGVYCLTRNFPKDELYGLTSQMRRCAVSIPSNVAEGFRRRHNKEYKQFLYIALGSCAELETQVNIARELEYIDLKQEDKLVEQIDHVCRMTMNLVKKL